jgi:predicted Kef-type K+ transport protein
MSHETSLIATLALSLIAALIGALAATRLRLPLLVGYLLGGVLIGPFTSRLADVRLAHQVTEVGLIQRARRRATKRTRGGVLATVGVTLAKVAAFFAVMLVAGKAIAALTLR